MKNGVADDLVLIREGKLENLKYICFDKESKNFNMLKVIMDSIRVLEEPNKGGRTKKVESISDKEPDEKETGIHEVVKDNENVFEFVSKRLLEKQVNGK